MRRPARSILRSIAILLIIGSLGWWITRALLHGENPQGLSDVNGDGKIVVLCFGDSVTKGSPRGTYPAWLRRFLGPSIEVINGGKYGERTRGGVVRLPQLLRELHPDYVILLEGVNDAVLEGCAEIAAIATNLRQMIDQIRQAGAVPLVGTIFAAPSYAGDAGEQCIDRINQTIDGLPAEKADFALPFRDHWDDLLFDGLHPNNYGCKALAEQALRALHAQPNIRKEIPVPSRTT